MTGQFFPGSCGDLNPACRGSLDFLMRERVSLRCVNPTCKRFSAPSLLVLRKRWVACPGGWTKRTWF